MISKLQTIRKVINNKIIERGLYPKQSGKKLAVLMYHGISRYTDTRFNYRFFGADDFEDHLIAFKKHFNIISFDDLENDRLSASRLNVLLTFDDGYANNFRYALPVLARQEVHAMFFITAMGSSELPVLWADAVDIVAFLAPQGSAVHVNGISFYLTGRAFTSPDINTSLKDYIKASPDSSYTEKALLMQQLLALADFTKDSALADFWQLMGREELQTMAANPLVTLGCHGYYHNNLGSLSQYDGVQEALRSRSWLEDVIQRPVTSIAYPDGSYTSGLAEALNTEGISNQFVVNFNDSGLRRPWLRDRIGLYPCMGNLNTMMYKIMR